MPAPSFVVIVPAKPTARGKSRLGAVPGSLPATRRQELAGAFVLDTVAAALEAPGVAQVVVVTDDADLASALPHGRCHRLPDGAPGDLNATLRLAADEARRRWPDLQPVALCADLPALTPAALGEALATTYATAPGAGGVTADAAFVPDLHGTGTTLYTAPYDAFRPRFGVGSRDAHLADGALELLEVAPQVRHDVDDAEDLERAVALGVGPRTAAVLTRD